MKLPVEIIVGLAIAALQRALAALLRGRTAFARCAAALLMLTAVVALAACGSQHEIRYRITMVVELFGEEKSASSVIETLFYGGGSRSGPYRYYTSTKGVAPVIDLGRYGWLVAARSYTPTDHERSQRQKALSLSCKNPKVVEGLLDAFGLDAADLVKVREGKRELKDRNLPSFIWFPRDQPFTKAKQVCPEEFTDVIGARVELKSATIEIAPGAPLKTVLDLDAPWLEEMRADRTLSIPHGTFFPSRGSIEKPVPIR